VPERHSLRPIRAMVNQVLAVPGAALEARHSNKGRPSMPTEYLLRAKLRQIPVPGALRAPTGGVGRLRVAIPLVYRTVDGSHGRRSPGFSQRTGTGCWKRRSRGVSCVRWWTRPAGQSTVRGPLSGWTAPGSRSGPRWSPFGPGAAVVQFPGQDATASGIVTGRMGSNTTHASETDPRARSYRKSWVQGAHVAGATVVGRLTHGSGR